MRFQRSTVPHVLGSVPVVARQHEYHLVPDRSRWLDFEVQQIQEVYAHYAGRADKVRVPPLYGDESQPGGRPALGYTIRRRSRRRTNAERTHGVASDYTGSDVFLSLVEPIRIDSAADEGVVELSVRALCTNRHLPEQLPIGEGLPISTHRRHATHGDLRRRPDGAPESGGLGDAQPYRKRPIRARWRGASSTS